MMAVRHLICASEEETIEILTPNVKKKKKIREKNLYPDALWQL